MNKNVVQIADRLSSLYFVFGVNLPPSQALDMAQFLAKEIGHFSHYESEDSLSRDLARAIRENPVKGFSFASRDNIHNMEVEFYPTMNIGDERYPFLFPREVAKRVDDSAKNLCEQPTDLIRAKTKEEIKDEIKVLKYFEAMLLLGNDLLELDFLPR